MPNQTYFITELAGNDQQLFAKLLSYLENGQQCLVEQDTTTHALVKYPDLSMVADLEYVVIPPPTTSTMPEQRVVMKCSLVDQVTPKLMRAMAATMNLRLFSVELGCFLPLDTALLDVRLSTVDPQLQEALNSHYMKLLYIDQSSQSVYAQTEDGAIHLVNPFIIRYALQFGGQNITTSEFSYPVAPSVAMFTALYDHLLVPKYFYQYYQRSAKILNDSYFDIDHINRKVFIKPLVYELDQRHDAFYTIAKEGSALLLMDKVRLGEQLEQSIKRILSQELHLATDFIAARVLPDLEFDRDRDNHFTPRLVIQIYIDSLPDAKKDEILPLAQRSWRSA